MVRDAYVAIADPTRREILELLNEQGTTPAGEIAARIGHVSRPAISRHLRILRECDLVVATRQGKAQNYTLNPAPINDMQGWLKGFSRRQVKSLKSLREIVESENIDQPAENPARNR